MPEYTPPSTGSGGAVAESSVTGLVSDLALKAPLASPTFSGTATFASTSLEGAFTLGKAGAIGATETNAADWPFIVPGAVTMKRMKAVLKTAASGAMTVQLRKAAAPGTAVPSYSDVNGFVVTFANGSSIATVTPGTALTASEGDLLNFSCATGSGVDMLVQVVTTNP